MPAGFDKCRRGGGRVRTVSGPELGLAQDEYMHVCFDKHGMHRGYVKKKNAANAVKEHAERRERKG